MRSLCYVTFLAILSVNVQFCTSIRLLAENPVVIPNGQPGAPAPLPPAGLPANIPANLPANIPANLPANLPANIPANLPANLPAHIPANLPANVPPEMLANVPPEMLANLPANVSPEMLANVPPEMLANLPATMPGQLPANVPPEMLASLAAAKQPGQPGAENAAASGVPTDLPPIPKMPDFSGLTDLSFPPMPSAKMPQMPHNITLFGFDVQIPKFINNMLTQTQANTLARTHRVAAAAASENRRASGNGVHLLLPPPIHRPPRRLAAPRACRRPHPARLQGAEAGRGRRRGAHPAGRAHPPRRRRGRRRQGLPRRRRLRGSSERVREAQGKHGLHRVQRRGVQADDPGQVEPQQGARVPRPGAPLRGQLRLQQQRLRHDQPNLQEDHHRVRLAGGVPLTGGLLAWQAGLRRQDRFRGRVRVRRGGDGQRPGELGAGDRREAVLQHNGADEDGGRRRGRQAPAGHRDRGGRQALHLQGAGRRQEVVQGRQEVRREHGRLLQRRMSC